MMTVLGCIAYEHNIWLVLVAVLLCASGSWVTARLFQRAASTKGRQRIGWYFLTALAAGVAIWCTHFVGMLGFEIDLPVRFDPILTVVSLLIAVVGSTAGFLVAGSRLTAFAPAIGGLIVGLAISGMHYMGMMAYRVHGIVLWDRSYVIASVVLSVVLSVVALHFAMQPHRHAVNIMAGVLSLAVAALHFTGMAAFKVTPMQIAGTFSNTEGTIALAFAIAGMSFLIVGAGLTSYLLDDSMRAESVERLRKMALSDTLTGLPNRPNFTERLDLEMELAHARGERFALIGIDLNRFKEINDTRGHNAGDEVLRVLGRRMKGLLREDEGEFIARTGGDEFSAIRRMDDTHTVSDFLMRLETALFRPIRIDDFEVMPGASFGVAVYPDDADSKPNLINNADLAMYRAKADPMRTVCFYEQGMDEAVRARRNLAADLRDAISRKQLSVHYQVQTSVSSGEIRGFEALLRWRHPRQGFVSPSEFIPIAEESGLILQIGEWVLREACATAATWNPPYKVAVNLSAVQFAHSDLLRLVEDVLAETGLPPDRLEIELTESAIFTDQKRALHTLRQIRKLGVGIALDDFGTGYSSLDTLRSFPFNKIKLDRSFVSENSPQGQAIIRAVLALGKSLNIPVLAEGIETQDQLSMLNMEGCDEAQGFLLGRPAPLDEIVGAGQITLKGSNGSRAAPGTAALRAGLPEAHDAIRLFSGADPKKLLDKSTSWMALDGGIPK